MHIAEWKLLHHHNIAGQKILHLLSQELLRTRQPEWQPPFSLSSLAKIRVYKNGRANREKRIN